MASEVRLLANLLLLLYILHTNNSWVISAPTGSGKTGLLELALCKLLSDVKKLQSNTLPKAIYLAPLKSLCSERANLWQNKLEDLHYKCFEMTSDSPIISNEEVIEAALLITTPEKVDVMFRTQPELRPIFSNLQLVLVDEIHTLSDSSRGAVLEIVLRRLLRCSEARIIAISATFPNISDLSSWFTLLGRPCFYRNFGSEFSPVPVRKIVLGYKKSKNSSLFQFDQFLTRKLTAIIRAHANGRPTLIFSITRKTVENTAEWLANSNIFCNGISETSTDGITGQLLRECLSRGVGFHHAGLSPTDRYLVEQAFVAGQLPVLVSTSTLSMGINLPAHLVIVKNTMQYVGGETQEYLVRQIQQMIGRAGRPKFDTSGTAIIMTSEENKARYEACGGEDENIESSLNCYIADHLNTEIAIGLVDDKQSLLEWIDSTFFALRFRKNPSFYGANDFHSPRLASSEIHRIGLAASDDLAKLGALDYSPADETLNCTVIGRLMSEQFLGYATVASFLNLTGNEKMNDLICFIAKCREFGDISLRQQEKYLLNRLNKASGLQKLRYPVPGSISSPDAKISVLLQAQLNDHVVLDSTLQADANKIIICFIRTIIGLRSIILLEEGQNQRNFRNPDEPTLSEEFEARMKENGFRCLVDIVELCKAVIHRLWPDHPLASIRQLPGIGKVFADRLCSSGITSIAGIEKSGPRKIEEVLSRAQPFGDNIYEAALKIPKYELAVEQVLTNTPDVLCFNFVIRLVRTCAFDQVAFIVGDDKNRILFKRNITTSEIEEAGDWSQLVSIQRQLESVQLFVSLLSLNFLGIDLHLNFQLPWPCKPLVAGEDPSNGYMPLAITHGKKCYQESPAKSCSLNKYSETKLINSQSDATITQDEATRLVSTGKRKSPVSKTKKRIQSRPPQIPASFHKGADSSFGKIKTPLIQTKIQNFFRKAKSFSEENPLRPSMDDKVPVKSSTSLTTPQVTLFGQPRTCEAKIDGGIGVEPPRKTPKRFKWDPHRVKQSTPNEKARRTLLGGPTSDHPPSKAVMNRTFGALLSNTPLPSSDGAERKPPPQTPLVLCHSVDKIVHSTATLDRSPGLILGLSPILPDNQSLDAEEGAEFSPIENSGSQQVGTRAPSMKLEDTHSGYQRSCSFAKPFPVKGCKRQDLNTFTLNDSPKGTHNCSGLEAVASDNSYRTPTFAELQEDSLCQPGSANVNFAAAKQLDGDRRRSLILNCRKPLHNSVPSSSPLRQPTVDLDTFPVTGSSRLPPNTPTDQGKFSKKVSFGSLCNLHAGTSTEKNKKITETVVGYGSEPTTFLLPTNPAIPFPTSQLEEIKDQKPESSQNENIRKSTEASKATNSDCLKEKQLTTRDFDLICSGWEELDTFICCYNILKELSSDASTFVTMSAPKTPPPTPAYGESIHGHSCPSVHAISAQVRCLSTGKFGKPEESQGMEVVHEVEE